MFIFTWKVHKKINNTNSTFEVNCFFHPSALNLKSSEKPKKRLKVDREHCANFWCKYHFLDVTGVWMNDKCKL